MPRTAICRRCREPVDPRATRCPHCTSRIILTNEVLVTAGMGAFGIAAGVVYSYQAALLACVVAGVLVVGGVVLIGKALQDMFGRKQ